MPPSSPIPDFTVALQQLLLFLGWGKTAAVVVAVIFAVESWQSNGLRIFKGATRSS